MWNLKVSPKVKTFVWKFLKRTLPVGERLIERHVDVDPRCKRCGASESITHLLFHCPFAQLVWLAAPFVTGFDPRGIVDLEERWTALCAKPCLPPTGLVSSPIFPWILWTIWKERNRVVFNGSSNTPTEALTLAIKAAKEWEQTQVNEKGSSTQTFTALASNTSSAPTIVIRTDAAWRKEDKTAGLGWTVQSPTTLKHEKKLMRHVASPLMAEGLAIREALLTCRSPGLLACRLESDSAPLIKAINRKELISELHGVLADIDNLCCSPMFSVSFSWIPRNQNVVADALAKEALCMVEAFMPIT